MKCNGLEWSLGAHPFKAGTPQNRRMKGKFPESMRKTSGKIDASGRGEGTCAIHSRKRYPHVFHCNRNREIESLRHRSRAAGGKKNPRF
jgi:hypothetical protein